MNRYHDQYLGLLGQITQALDRTDFEPSNLDTILDNLVTASLWTHQGKINWTQLSEAKNSPDGWTILDETVMLTDGLTDRFSDRDRSRKLGFFIFNLPEKKMHPGASRRWSDMCERVKKRSLFYPYEASLKCGSMSQMLCEFHRYFMERFGIDKLAL